MLIAGVLVLKALVASLESKLVFFPFSGEDATPASFGIAYRPVTLTTGDGARLMAWQLEPETSVADVVYFHGNGGNLSVWLPALAGMHRANLRVLAVDYRGYGLSTGTPSETGVYRDAEVTVRHAAAERSNGVARPLVYWGRSLGGPIAAYAAGVQPPDGLILESTFPDKASVLRTQPVLRALNVFSRYRFSTIDHLARFSGPVLVMHGDRDSVVPFALGRELFERLRAPKQFVTIHGANHNDAFEPGDDAYWRPVLDFVGRLAR